MPYRLLKRAGYGCLIGTILLLQGVVGPARGQPGYAIPQPVNPDLESQPVPEPRQDAGAEQGQDSPSQEQAESDRLIPTIKAIESAIRELVTEEDAQQRERQEDREIADLQAQEDMALWAKRMTWATVASVVLTFAGVCLIGATLYYTKIAAEAAVAASEEAKAIVAVTRDLGIRQIRAYVDIFTVDIVHFQTGQQPSIMLTIRNGGQTPANKVRIIAHAHIQYPTDDMFVRFREHSGYDYAAATLPATGCVYPTCQFPITMTDDLLKDIINGDRLVILAAYITYKDVFLKHRRTIIKWILNAQSIDGRGNATFRPCDKGNRST